MTGGGKERTNLITETVELGNKVCEMHSRWNAACRRQKLPANIAVDLDLFRMIIFIRSSVGGVVGERGRPPPFPFNPTAALVLSAKEELITTTP